MYDFEQFLKLANPIYIYMYIIYIYIYIYIYIQDRYIFTRGVVVRWSNSCLTKTVKNSDK